MSTVKFKYINRINPKIKVREFNTHIKNSMPSIKTQIIKDINHYVPYVEGNLKNSVKASLKKRDSILAWQTVYARFLYYGKVMVGIFSRSPFAMKGEKKVVTDRNLTLKKGTAFWFKKAKKRHHKKWVRMMKRSLFK